MARVTLLWLGWLIAAVQIGYLQAQEPPYKGKTIRVIVGFPSGGGSDAEGRVLARHLGKYIPGNPTLIVQNMPGADGLTSSNWFEESAKPDGLTLYYCVGGDDADLLLAKDAETILRQVLSVTPEVQEFVKAITKKHLR